MASEQLSIEYICPLTREVCINFKEPKENPFTGAPMQEMCAWGTRDGFCAVVKLMQAIYRKEGY